MRFFLIDRITEWEIGKRASALKNISLSEDFFDDHFPRKPIMPGVLILEGMAQLAGVLLEETLKADLGLEKKAIISMIGKTKFKEICTPGDQLVYHACVEAFNELGGRTGVQALKNGNIVASTTYTFIFQELDDPFLKVDRERLLELWLNQKK